jgi:hypothetical protein
MWDIWLVVNRVNKTMSALAMSFATHQGIVDELSTHVIRILYLTVVDVDRTSR